MLPRSPMSRFPARVGRLALAVLLCCGLGPGALAEEGPRNRGVRLAEEGRCESALPDLDTARLAAPADAELALLSAQCRFRLHHYGEAVRDFEAVSELAPDRADV